MKYEVKFDTQNEDEHHHLIPSEVPVLGVEPAEIKDGCVATYELDGSVTESEILMDLEKSDWCFVSLSLVEDSPEP